jgi:uncharacterized protein
MEKTDVKNNSFGRGIFAKSKIFKGEKIMEFTGPVISFQEAVLKPVHQLSFPLQISHQYYIDSQEPAVLVNHSCEPNAGIMKDKIIVALTDIEAGKEILYDYSTTMNEDNWVLEGCLCGSEKCRGIVKDFKYLSVELQKMYLKKRVVQSFIARQYQARSLRRNAVSILPFRL